MSDFKVKMHQIRFRRWGSLQRSPDPLAEFKGPTSKGRERRGREGEREVKEGQGKRKGEGGVRGKERKALPLL